MVSSFAYCHFSISQASVQVKLDKLIEDHQQGRRESTMISNQTVDSLTTEDRFSWRIIRKESEEIGITVAAFEANRDFIMSWLSHAVETGAFQEQNASGSVTRSLPQSPSTSSDSITGMASDTSAIYVSSEVYYSTEHYSHNSSSNRPIPSNPNTETLADMTISRPVVADESSTKLKVPHRTVSMTAEPYIACERCGKSNIAYELHMHCEQCNNGNYDLCLRCWREGRGCLNWCGFGRSAFAHWERIFGSFARNLSAFPLPHFLTGRRYRRFRDQQSPRTQANGAALIETSNSDMELESGHVCSNCSNFAQNTLWVCDICNDGEWAYCAFCVRGGRCCTHPLLPVSFTSPTNALSESSITSQSSEKTQQVSPLTMGVKCNICTNPIPPSAGRFHCPQCNEGDYDVCTSCYLGLVRRHQVSERDGPRGWRRCLKGHRMLIAGYDDSPRGQRYVISQDVAGGHALSDSDISCSADSPPPRRGGDLRVLALWPYWPKEVDDDELPFPKGAEIREYENINDDWSWGVYCGRKGLFPTNYCKEVV